MPPELAEVVVAAFVVVEAVVDTRVVVERVVETRVVVAEEVLDVRTEEVGAADVVVGCVPPQV